MLNLDNILETLIDNAKKLFFHNDWINMDLKFSKTEIFTMLLLDRDKEVTMTELTEYINSPMSTATGIADRLVKSGYISRERSEADRRIVILTLTDAGLKFIKDFKDLIFSYLKLILDDLSQEEKQFLIRTVFKIINRLETEKINAEPDGKDKTIIKKIDIQ
ncbi:MAG TPA: MarR family transcriptional regulator [Bacillota bacterium]|nr:MarR family transcriptional regulator [Bacillota bacterium]HOR85647.1 MarR family transcriptional regulator [Bacillota bacterium]HPL53979.1 MarR family transcriptional regulator [Bacillota bacterium]